MGNEFVLQFIFNHVCVYMFMNAWVSVCHVSCIYVLLSAVLEEIRGIRSFEAEVAGVWEPKLCPLHSSMFF